MLHVLVPQHMATLHRKGTGLDALSYCTVPYRTERCPAEHFVSNYRQLPTFSVTAEKVRIASEYSMKTHSAQFMYVKSDSC